MRVNSTSTWKRRPPSKTARGSLSNHHAALGRGGPIAAQQLAPLLLVQVGTQHYARQRDQPHQRKLEVKVFVGGDLEQRQQRPPPGVQPSAQKRLAKRRKCMCGGALYAAGDAFDMAEVEQPLEPLIDPRGRAQAAVCRPQAGVPCQLPQTWLLQRDPRRGQQLRDGEIVDDLIGALWQLAQRPGFSRLSGQ